MDTVNCQLALPIFGQIYVEIQLLPNAWQGQLTILCTAYHCVFLRHHEDVPLHAHWT